MCPDANTSGHEGSDNEFAQAVLVEVFRKALLAEHADDWTMETCAEAAHVCARAFVSWASDGFGDVEQEQYTLDNPPPWINRHRHG